MRVLAGHGARARRRGADRARRAPRPARAPDHAARSARRRPPRGAVRRPRRRGRAADEAGGVLARELDHGLPCALRGWRRSTSRSCWTGRRASGAVGFDVGELGCAFYAGSGQKWMCGPIGSGMLWVAPGVAVARGADRRDLREPRERRRRPRRRAAPRRPPLRLPGRRPRDHRRRARRPRRPGRVRLARGLRARDLARRRCSPRASRTPAGPSRRAARPRSCPSRTPTPRRPATASPRPASPSATCRGRRTCAPRSGAWNDESDLERLLAAL